MRTSASSVALSAFAVFLCVQDRVFAEGTESDAAPASVNFINDVKPLIDKLGCNRTKCHGSTAGKGEFRLSIFGADPMLDFAALTKVAEGRRINRVEPAKSLFLLKATASIPHKGSKKVKLAVDSPEYRMLLSWVARGAPWSDGEQSELVSIRVLPEKQVLAKGATKPLSVTAVFSDGTKRDVTRFAFFSTSDETVLAIDDTGRAKAVGFGESTVLVSYLRRTDTVRISVPQPLPSAFPQPPVHNPIDGLVFEKLKSLGFPPSDVCADPVFLRRVYLDAIGTLPTVEEARTFLADTDPQKRSKLIDRLLERSEFAENWALKWSDLFRIKTGVGVIRPAAAETYYRWVLNSFAQNKPYDQFARELLTADGSNYKFGAVNFFTPVSNGDPQGFAEAAALIFMGARVGCARCHVHPVENWTLEDDLGLAAFFATVSVKTTKEWTERIVYSDPKKTLRNPNTGQVVQPKFLGGEVVDLGAAEKLAQAAVTAAANARTAAAKAAAAFAAAQKTATQKRQQAMAAKKKVEKFVRTLQKPAETKLAAAAKTLEQTLAANKNVADKKAAQAAAKKLADAEKQKKAAEQALESVKKQVAATMQVFQAADKAASDAEAAANAAKGHAEKTQAEQIRAEKDVELKKSLAIKEKQKDPRTVFVDWLVSPQNPWFATNIVNRIWFWLLGRGIVHEADDLRSTNPPENPELLHDLAQELVSHHYDLKHIYRLILNSTTYQLSSQPNQWNRKDKTHFSHYQIKRLGAEQLLDAISQITETSETFRNTVAAPIYTLPAGYHAKHISDGSTESPFLSLFGRAARDTSFESQRNTNPSLRQALYIVNSDQFQSKVVNSPYLKRLIQEKPNDADVIEELYYAVFSRPPTDAEKKRVLDYVFAESRPAIEQAEAGKKNAEATLAQVKAERAKATTDYEAAEKVAKVSEAQAKTVAKDASKSKADKKKIADETATKRKAANDAKRKRDKLLNAEKAATAKLSEAGKKLAAAQAAHQKLRVPALQDVLWALLNTKEFLCNH